MTTRMIDYLKPQYGYNMEFPTVIADEILASINDMPSRKWTPTDFPCIYMPFTKMFIEARFWLDNRKYGLTERDENFWGVMLTKLTIDEVEQMRATYRKNDFKLPGNSAHMYILMGFIMNRRMGEVFHFSGATHLHVNQYYEWIDDPEHLYIQRWQQDSYNERGKMQMEVMLNQIPYALMTLSLLNSQNVVMVEEDPTPKHKVKKSVEKKLREQPRNKFYTLCITPNRQMRNAVIVPKSEGVEQLRAEHIRRGSRRRYWNQDGRRLLGKYPRAGSDVPYIDIFVPAHIVGDKSAGVVEKRYEVKP